MPQGIRRSEKMSSHTSHVITVETRLVEPQADSDGRLWECYEPTGAVSCSCGASWEGPEPEEHRR